MYSPPFNNTSGSFGIYPNSSDPSSFAFLGYPGGVNNPHVSPGDGITISNGQYYSPFCGFVSSSTLGFQFDNINGATSSLTPADETQMRKYNPGDATDSSQPSIIYGINTDINLTAYNNELSGNNIKRIGDLKKMSVRMVMYTSTGIFNPGELYYQISLDGGYKWTPKYYNSEEIDTNQGIENLDQTWKNEDGYNINNDIQTAYETSKIISIITQPTGSMRTFANTITVGSGPFASTQLLPAQSSSFDEMSPFNLLYVNRLLLGFTSTKSAGTTLPVMGRNHIGTVVLRLGMEGLSSNPKFLKFYGVGVRWEFNVITPQGKAEIVNGEYFQTKKGLIEINSGSAAPPIDPNTGVTP